jgi:hypothetical protein
MPKIDYPKLDKLLEELYNGDRKYAVMIGETYENLFKDEPDYDDDKREYDDYMAELSGLGLATERETSGTTMDITPFGRQVHKSGGWLAYNAQIQQKEDQETDLRLKEVNASLASADAGRKSMYASYIAIFISTAFALWQFIDGLNKQTEIDTIKMKINAIENSQSSFQLQHPKKKILPVDSTLKHKALNGKN